MNGQGVKLLRTIADQMDEAVESGQPIFVNPELVKLLRRLAKYYDEFEQFARDRDRQYVALIHDYINFVTTLKEHVR